MPSYPSPGAKPKQPSSPIDLDDVQKMVEAQMKNLTDPLKVEIQATTSWWGKIRNRLYITLMQQVVKAIVADVKQKIA